MKVQQNELFIEFELRVEMTARYKPEPFFTIRSVRWRACGDNALILSDFTLQWRHNGHDSVSNHQSRDCLLNRLFRRRSKKTSKFCVTGFVRGIHRWPVNSRHKGPVTRKTFPFDYVIMTALKRVHGIGGSLQNCTTQDTWSNHWIVFQWLVISSAWSTMVDNDLFNPLSQCGGRCWLGYFIRFQQQKIQGWKDPFGHIRTIKIQAGISWTPLLVEYKYNGIFGVMQFYLQSWINSSNFWQGWVITGAFFVYNNLWSRPINSSLCRVASCKIV